MLSLNRFSIAGDRLLGPAVIVILIVVVSVTVAVSAVSVFVTGDAVVSTTRTFDCPPEWCFSK